MSWIEKWGSLIWPKVQAKHKHVSAQRPSLQANATGTHYGEKVYQLLPEKGEIRNVTCNLTFTDPIENTMLQKTISFATVERFAIDMFIDTASVTPDDDQVAASAATDTNQIADDGAGDRLAEKILRAKKKMEDRSPGAQGL